MHKLNSTQPRTWTLHGYQSTSSALLKGLFKVMNCESAASICCGVFLQTSVAILRLLEHMCECMRENDSRSPGIQHVDATPRHVLESLPRHAGSYCAAQQSKRAQGPWTERTVRPCSSNALIWVSI